MQERLNNLPIASSSVTAATMRTDARRPHVPDMPRAMPSHAPPPTGISPALEEKMRQYATRYRRKHPNVKPERLMRIVAKKFNITLTTPEQ